MQNSRYVVYVKTDENNCIVAVNSSKFLRDTSGWIKIDEGEGEKYYHAQVDYFDSLFIETIPRYKLVDGKPVLRSEEEIAADRLHDLDALRAAKQEVNKAALADWLAAHPLTWTDDKIYGVTEQDQTEMAINLAQYQLAAAAGQPAALEWHAQKTAVPHLHDRAVHGIVAGHRRVCLSVQAVSGTGQGCDLRGGK